MSGQPRVERAREPLDAFRLAAQRPSPDSLISSLRTLYAGDRTRAGGQVERVQGRHVEGINRDHPQLASFLRCAQGHWPKIYRDLEAKGREARARAQTAPGPQNPDEDPAP